MNHVHIDQWSLKMILSQIKTKITNTNNFCYFKTNYAETSESVPPTEIFGISLPTSSTLIPCNTIRLEVQTKTFQTNFL